MKIFYKVDIIFNDQSKECFDVYSESMYKVYKKTLQLEKVLKKKIICVEIRQKNQ